ncbi:biotin-independent malonate decarboxylase subunit beta, partial [Stenotrophomonas maltophilia]|uniref:biotin-independent malonate decarboxylase subunit beta n=2 Tax=Lysobacteraceae TaxID=32033 RepID=UPI00066CE317
MNRTQRYSYYEADARERIASLVDAGSFREFLGPARRMISPHLAQLDQPAAFDDGIVVGEATLRGRRVLLAAQQGEFMGGGVGEVHGAKLTGLLRRAAETHPEGVLLLLDTGGVRLHEANAGLIAISEIMRATLDARATGVPVIALIGSGNGAFGGMGIVARCCSTVIMSEEGRLSLSGPEVIETVRGVEEFDSRDRALVWRVTGGKHRYLIDQAQVLVPDAIEAFAQAASNALQP